MRYIKIFPLDSYSFSVLFFQNLPSQINAGQESKKLCGSFKFYNWIENGDNLTLAIAEWIGNGRLPENAKGLEPLPKN